MSDVLRMSRKAFTVTVVTATIAWSIGLMALLAPLTVKAAVSGSLVKASMPAVYYVGADGKRYVFPNEKTYKTWYADFSGVVTITDSELASMPIGGNVTYRPGVMMVKINTDPKVYAVAAGGTLRWVTSESLAVQLYGANWNQKVHDVSDAFFVNYRTGTDITSASQFSPSGEMAAASSINVDKGLSGASGGSLSVSLTSDQPAGGTIPKGATGVNVLKFTARNGGSSAMVVDSLTVHRAGAGVAADIANVYVYQGNDRLTTGRTVNSSTNDASFSGLNLSLASGEAKTLWIAVDFAAAAASSNVHSFSLTQLSSGTTLASGLPLSGPSFTVSGAAAGSVTVSKSGTISNPKAGQMGAKVAEFQVAAGTSEDVDLSRISLYQGGSVSRDKFTNFVLKQAGNTLATVAALNSRDLAVMSLGAPVLIEKGNTKTFELFADIAASARSGETVKFWLDQTTDLLAVGRTYGYGVTVTNATFDGQNCTSSAGDCSYSSVDAGQLTMTFNGPAARDIPSNGKDVELFNFTMAAQSNLEVRKLQFLLTGNGDLDDGALTTPRLTDIKVVDVATGATVMGPKDSTAGVGYVVGNNSSTLEFTETFNLNSNQARTFKVTADIGNEATLTGGEPLTTVSVTLNQISSTGTVRNLDSSQDLAAADLVPNSAIAGNTNTLKAPSLTLSLSSTPVAQTYIKGSQNVPLMGVSLKAGDASDIRVNTLQFQGRVDTNDGTATCTVAPDTTFANGQENAACSSFADIVQTLKLWNGATQVSTTKSPGAGTDGKVTFDNMGLTVTKGTTLTLTVTGSISSALLAANLPDVLDLQLTNAATTVTDTDGNTVTATGGTLDGPNMTIQNAGTATVALAADDTETEAGLVIGGTSNAVLAKFRFTAQSEELRLTKVRMKVTAPTGVTSLSLYDGATLVGGPVSVDSSGVADFSGMTLFVIPKDGSKTLTVKGNLNTVSSTGAASGVDVMVTLDFNDNFELRGTSAGSNTLLTTIGTADVLGNQKILRRTKPTIALVALPTTALTTGEQVAMRLTVTADPAEQLAMRKWTVEMQVTAAPSVAAIVGNSSVRRFGDGANIPGSSAVAGAGCAAATAGVCTLTLSFASDETIQAGASKTYDVRVTIGGTLISGDSVAAKLLNEPTVVVETSDVTGTAPALGINGTARFFIWSDFSANPHINSVDVANDGGADASSLDWTNGSYVKILPTDTQTMTRS